MPTIPPNRPVGPGWPLRWQQLDPDVQALILSGAATSEIVTHGIYTPTFTSVANLDATPTATSPWTYVRVGNTVTVSGELTINPTAAATTQAGISLPIASDFTAAGECAGVGCSPGVAGQVMAVRADATNNRAELIWTAVDLTSQLTYVTFTYRIQ